MHPKNLHVLTLSPQLKKMKEKKGLYPDKNIYTQQIGPGLCFGALALMLRFFFEVPGLWGGDRALQSPLEMAPRNREDSRQVVFTGRLQVTHSVAVGV